jgi:hypothetical protein
MIYLGTLNAFHINDFVSSFVLVAKLLSRAFKKIYKHICVINEIHLLRLASELEQCLFCIRVSLYFFQVTPHMLLE